MKPSRPLIPLALIFPLLSWAGFENVAFSGAVDLVVPITEKSEDNRLAARGVELSFAGPIDPRFDGTLILAGHSHSGVFEWDLHEASLSSSKLLDRTRFRLGRFFLGVGRLNQTHQHDWPFIHAPSYHARFFAAEGVADEGLEFARPWGERTPLETVIGVTNGYVYGHSHSAGERPLHPLFYLRQSIAGEDSLTGLNLLTRSNATGEQTLLTGLDFVLKKREGPVLKDLFQAELWHRERRPVGADPARESGFYAFYQRGLDVSWFAGLRVDGFADHGKRFVTTGELRKDFDYALTPQVTWRSSEFALFRASYTRSVDTTQGDPDLTEQRVDVQFVYLLGAHPAHDF